MTRWLALAALLALPAACGGAAAGQGGDGPLAVSTRAVDITGGDLHGLKLLGTVELRAAHPAFGGFSGIVVREGRMIAVTDAGWLLQADLDDDAGGQRLQTPVFRRLRDSEGRGFSKRGGDAEGLALRDGELWISFERDHRLVRYDGTRPVTTIRDRGFETLSSNAGLEALAALPDGRLLAIAEGGDAVFPLFVTAPGGRPDRADLPRTDRHDVTGADVGPDGRLYVVLRHYVPMFGVSIRIRRYGLTAAGLPDPDSREDLAAFDSASGIDNMEGIALWTDQRGRVRLALISDDNFSLLQRTLLMDFEVLSPGR